MHTLRPRSISEPMAAKVERIWHDCRDVTPESILARDLGASSHSLHVEVPSEHLSRPGRIVRWEVRLEVRSWGWQATHYGQGCPADMALRPCGHLYAAALFVAQYALIPGTSIRRFPSGRIPDPLAAPLRRLPTPIEPRRPVTAEAQEGFYG